MLAHFATWLIDKLSMNQRWTPSLPAQWIGCLYPGMFGAPLPQLCIQSAMVPYPEWLHVLAWVYIGICLACALSISIHTHSRPQKSGSWVSSGRLPDSIWVPSPSTCIAKPCR